MIKEVYLFTNRNVIAFDEKGEQAVDIQKAISWDVDWLNREAEREALRKIIEDQPKVYIAKWKGWAEEITLDELCSILGHGKWFWENYKKRSETAKAPEAR